MDVSQIVTLLTAGYTKAEIDAMNAPAEQPQEVPEQPQPENTDPQPETNTPTPDSTAALMALLEEQRKQTAALAVQLKEMQTDAARAAREPAQPEKMSADSVIRAFLGDSGKR